MAKKKTVKKKRRVAKNRKQAGRRLEYKIRDWFKNRDGVIEVLRMAASIGSADLVVAAENYDVFVQVKKNRPSRKQIENLEKLFYDGGNTHFSRYVETHIISGKSHDVWYFDGENWREYLEDESDPIVQFRTRGKKPRRKK